jgi:hypothetical protein
MLPKVPALPSYRLMLISFANLQPEYPEKSWLLPLAG